MRTSMRWWSRLAFVASLGMVTLVACGSDRPNHGAQEQRAGTLTLPLRTVSSTGSVYFLRNAFFEIFNQETGEVTFVSTEEGLADKSEIVLRLPSGVYTITLFQGWFLERFGEGGGGGTGGSSHGGFAGEGPIGGASEEGTARLPPRSSAENEGGAPSSGGTFGVGGSGIAGTAPIGGGVPVGGTGGTGPIGGGEVVRNARLVNGATQFFFLEPQGESFVTYSFRVGDDVIEFNRGNLHIGFEVDDQPLCEPPSDVTHVERVLLETNVEALAGISLEAVFSAIANNGGHTGNGIRLYQQIFDSFATADQARLPEAVHCGDEMTNGQPTLNGYRIDCDRAEAAHVDDMDKFFATAFVNRLDLAPANGAHCGQQRMVFANNNGPGSFGFGRTFMIIEAQVPNPSPELGIEGCRPLAQFWLDQNGIDDPLERGQRLQQAFLSGEVAGIENFPPFYTAENLTVGSGQIRTNQFDSDPWTLREFKLTIDPNGSLSAVPFPVAESPMGALWDETEPLPRGEACRDSFLSALEGVLTDNLSLMSFVVDPLCKDAESRNDFSEDYASSLARSPNFQQQIQAKLDELGSTLTPQNIASRARFSGSCIGCHQESGFEFLGNNVFAPRSSDFPQIVESQEPCGDGSGSCFGTSFALKTVFLPGRLNALGALVPVVQNPCDSQGGGGSTGAGGASSTGGSIGTGGRPSMGGVSGGSGPRPQPAPSIEIELPSTNEPVELLQEEDKEIRDEYGDVTISGRSAKSTH